MPYFSQDRPQGRLEAKVAFVLDAAVFDVQAQEQRPSALFVPADVIVEVVHVVRVRIGQRAGRSTLRPWL